MRSVAANSPSPPSHLLAEDALTSCRRRIILARRSSWNRLERTRNSAFRFFTRPEVSYVLARLDPTSHTATAGEIPTVGAPRAVLVVDIGSSTLSVLLAGESVPRHCDS